MFSLNTGFYTGKEIDPDTGLYYFNARWYDPDLGRFITEDPIKDGTNWHVYCRNNPLKYVDPTGLEPDEDLLDEEIDYYTEINDFDGDYYDNDEGGALTEDDVDQTEAYYADLAGGDPTRYDENYWGDGYSNEKDQGVKNEGYEYSDDEIEYNNYISKMSEKDFLAEAALIRDNRHLYDSNDWGSIRWLQGGEQL